MDSLSLLPLANKFESKSILKQLTIAHRALAELKGVAGVIPNQGILISTLSLQEAKDSSAIENIITTHDELYMSDSSKKQFTSAAAKGVYSYAAALNTGYHSVRKAGLLTITDILEIQSTIEENSAGFRALPGTELKNEQTGRVVYTPPQSPDEIRSYMQNLEKYINTDSSSIDPLTKMAIIHHQFESIHPFYDGNGRTGRIINVLFLVKEKLLDTPVLYLSRYINRNKGGYYELLQEVRQDQRRWEDWILDMLKAVTETSYDTIQLIQGIRDLKLHHKALLKRELPKIYSQDLLANLFRHPYTKVDFVTEEIGVHRNTARKYLDELVQIGLLTKNKMAGENYYINIDLFNLLESAG